MELTRIIKPSILREIRRYLAGMEWAESKNYKLEELYAFLHGITLMTGLAFRLKEEKVPNNYRYEYSIDVIQYSDPSDCWSERRVIVTITPMNVELKDEVIE